MNYSEIITSLKHKDYKPVYFLMGKEAFYIDKIIEFACKNILNEEQQEFNLSIIYGKDIKVEDIVSESKQFPFGSEKRLVIVKEAQHIRNIDKLEDYIKHPQSSTILFICYKGKTIDKPIEKPK